MPEQSAALSWHASPGSTTNVRAPARSLSQSRLITGTHRFAFGPSGAAQHEDAVRAAHAWIDSRHSAVCDEATPKFFANFAAMGIGNDINQAVRSLAIALSRGRQLVLLPPSHVHRSRLGADVSRRFDAMHPWHWLPDEPLSALFRPSGCQTFMSSATQKAVLDVIAFANASAPSTLQQLGMWKLANSSVSQSQTSWRIGLSYLYIPLSFRSLGMLWWFQALTTYFVRIGVPFKQRIMRHPATKELLQQLRTPGQREAELPRRDSHASICVEYSGLPRCYGTDLLADIHFDVGLHMRLGDACRPEFRQTISKSRACIRNLSHAVHRINEARGLRGGGTLFLATDSAEIIAQASQGLASPYQVFYLNLRRDHYDSVLPNELRVTDRQQDLVDMLIELLMLARSALVVGTMQSNVARLALQFRMHPPGDSNGLHGPLPALMTARHRGKRTLRSGRIKFEVQYVREGSSSTSPSELRLRPERSPKLQP
ncbi:hypothetical protein AB1Y20_009472 [Prymnesium parvum]|uniref:O-fucosyltransferase family protein n=1 Tax=Prymnesium parvum TaxID=97485 RepID=A0AB34K4P4_PRYPA